MTDDYSAHPTSLTEHKATKSMDARDWTPRDALIFLLRKIDAGEDIDALFIAYMKDGDDECATNYVNATKDPIQSIGLIEAAKNQFMLES